MQWKLSLALSVLFHVPFVKAETVDYKEIEKFSKILQFLEDNYVEPVKQRQLLESAIKGMLMDLDPHSSYLEPKIFAEMQSDSSGRFGGLGIEVSIEENWIVVVSPIDDTPAYRAGILAGDKIITIQDKSTKGMSLAEAVELMRGKPGEPIKITISRGTEKPFEMTLKREIIKTRSVRSEVLGEDVLYVRISQFVESTSADLERILRTQVRGSDKIKGLILDMRGNPGGLLNQAVRVSNLFLDNGVIVYTQGRDANSKEFQYAQSGLKMTDLPIVALVNGSSASASEIVAGALQDHKRALVAGQKTFGKGSVQTVIPLGDKSGLKVTIARYYTPNGRSIQATGIEPDFELLAVDPETVKKIKEDTKGRSEADLEKHIDNGAKASGSAAKKTASTLKERLENDYMVGQARGILKLKLMEQSKAQSKK